MRHQNRSSRLRWTATLLSLCLFAGAIDAVLEVPNSSYAQSPPALSAEQTAALTEAKRLNDQVMQLYQEGKFSEVMPLAERVLAIYRNILGENHLFVATSLNNLSLVYIQQGRYSEAEALCKKALEIRQRNLGKNDPEVADSINNLAAIYAKQGRYSEAEPLYKKALELSQLILGENHPDVATSFDNLAGLYQDERRYLEAEVLFKRALDIRQHLGKNHPDFATSLNDLAGLYKKQGRYGEAEPLFKQALELRKRILGENHPNVANTLNNLADLYEKQGRYGEAEPLFKQALELRKRILGESHPDVAASLNDLAFLYYNQGRYGEAESLFKQALELIKHVFGENHPSIASGLNNLGALAWKQGRYREAENLYKQALELSERMLGKSHPEVATCFDNLANLYTSQGRYSEAEPLYKQALELRKHALSENHPRVALSLNNLAALYVAQGRYSEAEPLYKQALELYRRTIGITHPDSAQSLNNLAELYTKQGRYTEAEPLYRQALAIYQRSLGVTHPDFALILNNLATLYDIQEHYSEAEPLYKQALAVFKYTWGEAHPLVVSGLNNLATLYVHQQRYGEAEPLYKKALELRQQTLSKNHPDVASSLNNLAGLYFSQEHYSEAEPLYKKALELRQQTLSKNHPDVIGSLINLAALYERQGNFEGAIKSLKQGIQSQERNLEVNLVVGSEQQKRDYIATLGGTSSGAIALHLQYAVNNSDAARLALTTILQRKGRILDALTDNLNRLRQNLTPADQTLLDKLASVRTQLATLYYGGLGTLTPEQYKERITQLQQQSTQLEADLNNRSAAFRTENQPITIEAVQKQIPADAALVELVRYYPFKPKAKPVDRFGKPCYAAYILSPQGTIQAVDLGDAATIDLQAEAFRQALRSRDSRVKAIARQLDAKLMQPIRAKLGNVHNLLLSPDSQLNLIPFAALVDEQNRYLVETYNINYLTSGRDLLRLQTPVASRQPPILMANPDYADPGNPASAQLVQKAGTIASNNPANLVASTQPTGARGTNQRSTNLANLRVEALPGTAAEANAIAPKLKDAIVLTGSEATENALKQVQAPRILHIATHGFFLEDAVPSSIASRSPTLIPIFNSTNSLAGIRLPASGNTENALLRSGLALAGFNVRQSGSEDGVLTAQEAAGLDLRGTQLVVLSACETGIGNIANGEGVYGLRRAFVLAGAASQLTSLWQVSDAGTKDLMVQYYDRLLSGAGRSDALRQTQLEFLHSANYTHPYYWAAFVPSGDWRPLK